VVPSSTGLSAHTDFAPLQFANGLTLVRCEITSGRTHQIRVHAQSIGAPVLGDALYGKAQGALPRALYLHAAQLTHAGHTWSVPMPAALPSKWLPPRIESDELMMVC